MIFFLWEAAILIGVLVLSLYGEKQVFHHIFGFPCTEFLEFIFLHKRGVTDQNPKLIVLEVMAATWQEEYSQWGWIVQSSLSLKPSKLKIESILTSSPDKRRHLFLGFPIYHTRYKELSKYDFIDLYQGGAIYPNGYLRNDEVAAFDRPPDVSSVTTVRELPSKQLVYLLKIIEIAKEQNIQLLLIKSPIVIDSGLQEFFNSIELIAKDHNLRFINYNLLYDDLEFDFTTDFRDQWHVNHSGSMKLSRHLAAEYGLPDRRQDPAYADWNKWAGRLTED